MASAPPVERIRRTGPAAVRAHLIPDRAFPLLIVLLAGAVALTAAVAIAVGTVSVPLADVAAVTWAHLTPGDTERSLLYDQIVWDFRVPRVLLAGVAGAGLSIAGVCLQALVRNPLADPYLLGISSGASVGAVVALTLAPAVIAGLGVAGAAFAGALASVALVVGLAQRAGRVAPGRLILAGVAVGYLGSAVTSYIQLEANPSELRGIMFWLLGSVATASWSDLLAPAVALACCLLWLLVDGRRLNALTMGETSAAGLGIDVNRLRLGLLAAASLLTATIVSVAGGIGFVGLLVPHAVRLLVGPDHRRVVPVSLLLGAVFLIMVDLLSRTLDRPNEMPIGIFTAAIGAPFFLWLLRRQSGAVR
ncbi:FecCD family ABC transporter permease [Micromonospora endophytica]|uniref:ABC transporter permease n=1 Tax=Micromonospora endophytica TaxID=515350 RepID=A0A2W2CJH6_9ACTN|nr:iron ABC transporter permease [Micromonospora endophytica]PZF98652.1 ABC transporter permease [Micromonospora endophytica]RIW45203.1 iron ABC transporter permease [Micromonospora endophytica]BCJ59590.1 ABC transporter permease [Micromonospora endophytica]